VKHDGLEIGKEIHRFRALGNKVLQTVMERKVGMSNYKEQNSIIQKCSSTFYSNKYPTRCNVTQFILSGNCSACFGW
jgi:hypothetical protein